MDELAMFGTGKHKEADARLASLAKDLLYENVISDIEDYSIILLDTHGNIISWNKGAERIKGYAAEEIIGKNFRCFYQEEDLQNRLPERLLEEARVSSSAVHEGWRVGKYDDVFWASVAISAIHDDNGKLTGFIKITRDLSERMAAEKVINEYETNLHVQSTEARKLRDLYYNFISEVEEYSIIMLNESGNVIDWNKGASKLTGYSPEEVHGKHFSTFYSEEDRLRLLPERLLARAKQNEREQHEDWLVRKDGTLYWASTVITVLKDNSGMVKGFTQITKDLTERMLNQKAAKQHAENLEQEIKKVQERDRKLLATLEKRNKLSEIRREFARSVSENFADISGVIKGAAGKLYESGPAKEQAHTILVNAEVAFHAINNLVWLGKLEEENVDPQHEQLDLKELIVSIINSNNALLKAGQDIIYSHKGEKEIVSSSKIITQAVNSILVNAILYSKNGDITVTSENTGKNCLITVKDIGPGIPEEIKPNIFNYFYRGENVKSINGTGLSLYIAKNLLLEIDASIHFSSVTGEGSTFSIKVPIL